MPRIPDDELARLKAIPLAELCQDYGIELKPQGKDLAGRCPFHADNSPSFIVTPSKNLWHCLGACGCGGDTIALVMKKEAVSFRHACEKLRARLGCAPAAATITTGGADGVRFKLLRSTMTNAPGARPLPTK
jgi:DNA primase